VRNSYKSKYYLRLKSEIREVKKDIEEVDSLYSVAQSFFINAVNEYSQENELKNPLLQSDKNPEKEDDSGEITEEETSKIFSDSDSEIKALWRKLVVKSHPDKNSQESEETREEREQLYKGTVEAKKNGDLYSVIEAAKSLDVDIPEINFDHLNFLEKQLKNIKRDLDKIYNSYPWVYYFSGGSKRVGILESFFKQHSDV
jgi:hypothetical protein